LLAVPQFQIFQSEIFTGGECQSRWSLFAWLKKGKCKKNPHQQAFRNKNERMEYIFPHHSK